MRGVFRVGLYVEMDAEGGDWRDAASGAAAALVVSGVVSSPFAAFPAARFVVVDAVEVSSAARSGRLVVVPAHRGLGSLEARVEGLVEVRDQLYAERAGLRSEVEQLREDRAVLLDDGAALIAQRDGLVGRLAAVGELAADVDQVGGGAR